MSTYLDASVAVSIFVRDDHSPAVYRWAALRPRVIASLWTATEFTSGVSLARRNGRIGAEIQEIEDRFDRWLAQSQILGIEGDDFRSARTLMRRHTLLRAGDAMHLAIARREGIGIATLDKRLADGARAEGLDVVDFGD